MRLRRGFYEGLCEACTLPGGPETVRALRVLSTNFRGSMGCFHLSEVNGQRVVTL
jgi:hypothetical protein